MPVIEVEVDEESEATLHRLRLVDGGSPDRRLREVVQTQLRRMAGDTAERLDDEVRWQSYIQTGQALSHAEVDVWLGRIEHGAIAEWPISD